MDFLAPEFRLLYFACMNAAVLSVSFRFVRRWGSSDGIQKWLDTLLLWYGVQYAAVCLPGMVGGLSVTTMSACAIVICGGLAVASRGTPIDAGGGTLAGRGASSWYEVATCVAAVCFAAGNLGAYVWTLRFTPVLSTDGLAYHMPVALEWLRSGRITTFDAWYWNPANAYSPLAGEAFIAWLYAPLGADPFAKFVQIGAGPVLLLAVVQVGRAAGLRLGTATILAAAVVVARPFRIEQTIVKDDLFVAAFFFSAAAACRRGVVDDRLGAYRVGLSVGLLAAVKYPALLALPLLLLLADAPLRAGWRWRHFAIAVAIAFMTAGPWFVRNLIRFGNPLYPVDIRALGRTLFPGLFTLERDPRLGSIGGLWGMLTEGHYGLPVAIAAVLLCAAAGLLVLSLYDSRPRATFSPGASVSRTRLDLRDPFVRFTALGTLVGTAVFALASPHPETRYFLPFMPPMFLAVGLVAAVVAERIFAARRAASVLRDVVAWVFLVGCGASTFILALWEEWIVYPIVGAIAAGVGVAGCYLAGALAGWMRQLRRAAAVAVLCVAAFVYVYWASALEVIREMSSPATWTQLYGPIAEGWQFVATDVPAGATVAYANTNLLYPLQHTSPGRRLIHVPARPDFASFGDLPHLGHDLDGYALTKIVTGVMTTGADRDAWVRRVRASGAEFLFVAKKQVADDPPELAFARQDMAVFTPVFENDSAVVFRITSARP